MLNVIISHAVVIARHIVIIPTIALFVFNVYLAAESMQDSDATLVGRIEHGSFGASEFRAGHSAISSIGVSTCEPCEGS